VSKCAFVGGIGDSPHLRILHVTEAFGSGVFEALRLIANAGASDGHSVHVAHGLRPSTPDGFAELFDARVSLHPLRWGPHRSVRQLVRGTVDLRQLLRSQVWDVVHFHSTFAGVAGAVTVGRNVRTVYTPHGYAFLMESLPSLARACTRMIESGIARRMAVIGAVSSAEAAQARRIGARNVEVIYNGIAELDPDRVEASSALTSSASREGVIAVGRMTAQRQPQAVARIFRSLDGAVSTSWVGDTDNRSTSQELHDAGASVTGWLPRDAVLDRMRSARVYLHWAAWDGHPLSVLEAISQGAVVVAYDIAPVREIVGSAQVCDSEEEAVARITALLEDTETYAKVQRAQLAGVERFSRSRMTASWQELYSRLAAPPTAASFDA
jgi:glycosyltransferase involved in cell wall biosynthesis